MTRKSLLGLKRTTSRLGSQFRDFRDSIRRPSRLYSRFGHQDYSVYRHSKNDVNHAKKKELSDFERHFTDKELKALGDKTAFIHPRSTFRIYWEILTIIPTLLSIIFVPIEFAFCNQWTSTPEYNFFLMFMPIDTWFLVDMILNYHTGYVDKKRKIIIMNKTLVTRHYLHSVQIFIDFLTSVPLDIIFNLFAYYVEILLPGTHIRTWLSPDGLRMLRLIKILRYFRGMKYIFRTVELVGKQYEQALAIFRFTKIFMTIVITVHILGITQWSIPMLYSFPEDSWPVRANIVKAGATSYKFISETRFTNEHDAKQFVEIVGPVNFEQHEWQTIYWWCLIKALSQTLTLAYGTAPHCTPEIIITMICMLIGALLWGILLGNLINFFQSQHVNQDTYNLKMREVVSYANFKSLPLVSKQLIFKFFEMRWLGKVFNEEEILQELSPVLRRKVLQFTRLDYIRRSPIFRDCSTQFLLEISYCMKDELYMPNQLVASIGRQCETIIVPYQGELLQYIPTLDIMEVVKVGMLLGECSIIRREFWNGEVYSLGWTRAYILNPVDVKDIGRMFPKDYLKILRNFKKSMGLVDDLPFINDINDKLEDLREQLQKRIFFCSGVSDCVSLTQSVPAQCPHFLIVWIEFLIFPLYVKTI